jgi:hypothetical protein
MTLRTGEDPEIVRFSVLEVTVHRKVSPSLLVWVLTITGIIPDMTGLTREIKESE